MTDQHTRPARDFDLLTVIETEGHRFAEVLAGSDLDAPVPTCPGWTGRDLLKHLIEVHGFWAAVIGDRLQGEAAEQYANDLPAIEGDADELLRQRHEATGRLVGALRSRQPDEEAWSWFDADQTVDFTHRMQTQEATLHRVDAELTAGVAVSPIADDVAAAGVDHVLDVMLQWLPDDAEITPGAVVELRATDTGERWLLELYRWNGTAWGQEYANQIGGRRADEGAEPVALVAGPVQQLELLVWSRPAEVDRSGDERALAELQELLDFGIQ